MPAYNIALAPGDGVGPEVVAAAHQVLQAVETAHGGFKLNFKQYLVCKAAYDATGNAMAEETLEALRTADAVLMGAMDTGKVPPPSPMGLLRNRLQLFADVRPIKSFPGVWSLHENIDMVVVRETTQGFLPDRNMYKGNGEFMPSKDMVLSMRVISREGCERIARFAFEFARAQKRKKVTAVHKANVLRMGCGFFLEVVREVAKAYPEIELDDDYVDSVANFMISKPGKYDVLLTTNMFGDVISDEAAALVSSLVPTANYGPSSAVFRPVHEGKPKEAGQNITNPIPTILCGSMLLRHLGQLEAAKLLEDGVAAVLAAGKVRTFDLGGNSATTAVADAICAAITKLGGGK